MFSHLPKSKSKHLGERCKGDVGGEKEKKERQRKTQSGREMRAGFREERLQRKLLNYKKDSYFRDSGRICQVCLDLWNKIMVFLLSYRI